MSRVEKSGKKKTDKKKTEKKIEKKNKHWQCLESPLMVKHLANWTMNWLKTGYEPCPPPCMSTSCPPDVTHVMNSPRTSPFCRSSASVYYCQWNQIEKKQGRPGNAPFATYVHHTHTQHYLLPGSWTWRGYSSVQLLHGMRPDWQPVWHAVYGGRCRYGKRGKKIWRTHRLTGGWKSVSFPSKCWSLFGVN